jgi:histone H3/H4
MVEAESDADDGDVVVDADESGADDDHIAETESDSDDGKADDAQYESVMMYAHGQDEKVEISSETQLTTSVELETASDHDSDSDSVSDDPTAVEMAVPALTDRVTASQTEHARHLAPPHIDDEYETQIKEARPDGFQLEVTIDNSPRRQPSKTMQSPLPAKCRKPRRRQDPSLKSNMRIEFDVDRAWCPAITRRLFQRGGSLMIGGHAMTAAPRMIRAIATEGIRAASLFCENDGRRIVNDTDIKRGFASSMNKHIHN